MNWEPGKGSRRRKRTRVQIALTHGEAQELFDYAVEHKLSLSEAGRTLLLRGFGPHDVARRQS